MLSTLTRRSRFSLIHFASSALVATITAAVVFGLWFPPPFALLSDGLRLFLLVIGIDVVLGPMLTWLVAKPDKPARELKRDVACIVAVQLLALGYGLYALAQARPTHVVFEVDRLRIVAAADLDADEVLRAPQPLRDIPWTGPRLIAVRKPTDGAEMLRSVDLGLAGFDLAVQSRHWVPYESMRDELLRVARPASELVKRHPEQAGAVAATGIAPERLRFLPVTARQTAWAALIHPDDARVLAWLPVDGFL